MRGVGLDTLIAEPPDPGHPLLALPQVIVMPHLGSQTDGATNHMGRLAMQDCLAVLRGEAPRFPVRA
jgi:phosphoglycerate dehydrogenase-like enzyme